MCITILMGDMTVHESEVPAFFNNVRRILRHKGGKNNRKFSIKMLSEKLLMPLLDVGMHLHFKNKQIKLLFESTNNLKPFKVWNLFVTASNIFGAFLSYVAGALHTIFHMNWNCRQFRISCPFLDNRERSVLVFVRVLNLCVVCINVRFPIAYEETWIFSD